MNFSLIKLFRSFLLVAMIASAILLITGCSQDSPFLRQLRPTHAEPDVEEEYPIYEAETEYQASEEEHPNYETETQSLTDENEPDFELFLSYLEDNGYIIMTSMSFDNFLDVIPPEDQEILQGWERTHRYVLPTSFMLPGNIIGMKLADFDGDGTVEMLVIMSEWMEEEWNEDEMWGRAERNQLFAKMLRIENETVVESARIDLDAVFNPGSFSFSGNIDVFTKPFGDGYTINVQKKVISGGIWANGGGTTLSSFIYDDGTFISKLDAYFEYLLCFDCCGFDPEESTNKIRNTGFTMIDYTLERAISIEPQVKIISIVEWASADWILLEDAVRDFQDGNQNRDFPPITIEIHTSTTPQQQDHPSQTISTPASTPELVEPTTGSDGFIFPESNVRYLTDSEVSHMTAAQLRIARNEIFARHGRLFDSEDLRNHFEAMDWYFGHISPQNFSESVLNRFELANIALIQTWENIN